MSEPKPVKVAILGSGVASLAAALELSARPDWQTHFDITIYQPGWRSGGKTTTGRGPNQRVEEVGIHIFQGWYNNAFTVVQTLYGEIAQKGLAPDSPFKTWTDAFAWENSTLLTEYSEKENHWLNWPIIFPNNDQLPGGPAGHQLKDILHKVVVLVLEAFLGSPYGKKGCLPAWLARLIDGQAEPPSADPSHLFRGVGPLTAQALDQLKTHLAKHYRQHSDVFELQGLKHVQQLLSDFDGVLHRAHTGQTDELHQMLHLLQSFMAWVDRVLGGRIAQVHAIRRLKTLTEFAIVTMHGILNDVLDVPNKRLDFDRINHLDFRQWLQQNGASELLLNSAPVRFLYTGTFANGVNQIEAGTALHFLALSVGYRGAFVWKFRAGTGDTLIMPFYLVLKARGVKFAYFHKALEVEYADGPNIERIRMAQQVKLREGLSQYDPRMQTPDGLYAWPAQPLYDQIDPTQAAALRAQGVDLESAWSTWTNYREYTLQRGVDFDEVLLGVPIEVLRGEQGICRQIIARRAEWARMSEALRTTATQSAQVWAYPSTEQMGMKLADWGLDKARGAQPNLVVYANPMYSWIDMSDLLPYEQWPAQNQPKFLAYLCGSLDNPDRVPLDQAQFPQQELARVQTNTLNWLQSQTAWFFPAVANPPEFPAGMRLDVLWAQQGQQATPEERLREQYYRANVQPSDRWTLSLPNTGKHRLAVDGSGYDNLFLAGDWVQMEINVGYTDGAMTSGLRSAQALERKYGLAPQIPVAPSGIVL